MSHDITSPLASPGPSPYSQLSVMERDILELALEGKPNKAIARLVGRSLRSVERYRACALKKLGVQTVVEAAQLRKAASAKSESLLLAAFRGSAHGMSLVTPDLRIAAVNATYCRILGYQEIELLEQPLRLITHPDDLAANVMNAERLFSGAAIEFRMRKRYLRRCGDAILAELSVTVVHSPDGTPQFGFGKVSVAS